MDFDLTDEQELLRDTTHDVLARFGGVETRTAADESELGWSRAAWSRLADIGILGLGFDPEESGPIEIMVVLTEMGRLLSPEPVAAAALIPGALIAEWGDTGQRALLDEVAEGRRLLAFAHQEPGMRAPTAAAVSTRAQRHGDSWTVSGRKNPVLAADCADTLVVSATLPGGGVGLFLVDAAKSTRIGYRTFDGRRGAQVDLDSTPAEPLGAGGDATAPIAGAVIRFQSALCAEAVGAMAESLHLTCEYLKSRKQFGVLLSNFQTLTQRAADMYVSLELARSMNFYAAMSIADGALDPVIAARAKLQISRSGRHIAQESIQLHGGIGMTAEYPVGHYAARLTAIEQTFGSPDDHVLTLATNLAGYDTVAL